MKSTYFENDENLQIRVLDKPIVLDLAGSDAKAAAKFIPAPRAARLAATT